MANGVVIGPGPADLPDPVRPWQVETRARWSDAWEVRDDLRVKEVTRHASASDLDRAVLIRNYGQVRLPHEDQLYTVSPLYLNGYWVRLSLVMPGNDPPLPQFVGRIADPSRTMQGTKTRNAVDIATGVQEFVVYGPLQELRKIHVNGDYVWDEERQGVVFVDWNQGVNRRDDRNFRVGNRSSALHSGSPLFPRFTRSVWTFGGTSPWNRRRYIEYLIAFFAETRAANGDLIGPMWTLVDYQSMLEEEFIQDVPTGATVAELLASVIRARFGADFFIQYITDDPADPDADDSFVIKVFSHATQTVDFGGTVIPANTAVETIEVFADKTIQVAEVEESEDQAYTKIEMRGNRVVVCCSLAYGESPATLLAGWGQALEDDYNLALRDGDDDDADANDVYRQRDLFQDVYQRFVAPPDWAHSVEGTPNNCAPNIGLDGQWDGTYTIQWQNWFRRTLPWLPLLEGYDYSDGQSLNLNLAGVTPDQVRPQAWLFDDIEGKFVPAAKNGISISVLADDLGVRLESSPNHLIALDYFGDAADGATATDPLYDFRMLVVTLAFETDQRLRLRVAIPTTGEERTKVIDGDWQLWFLAQSTAVGISPTGILQNSGAPRVLRNDVANMRLEMAGAILRYLLYRPRGRAEFAGHQPMADMLGKLLNLQESANSPGTILPPVTSVSWHEGDDSENPTAQTTIRTGYAR